MRPVAVVRCLVEADAVGARGGPNAARQLLVGIELQVANEVARVVVEVGEVLSGRLLEGHCDDQLDTLKQFVL